MRDQRICSGPDTQSIGQDDRCFNIAQFFHLAIANQLTKTIADIHCSRHLGLKNITSVRKNGCYARTDIIILDKNPLEDIKNTQSIWRVIKGGWVFNPEELKPDKLSDEEK